MYGDGKNDSTKPLPSKSQANELLGGYRSKKSNTRCRLWSSSSPLRILLGNVEGLLSRRKRTKKEYLMEKATRENAMAIIICETHLKGCLKEAEIVIKGYEVFRKDRALWQEKERTSYIHKEQRSKNDIVATLRVGWLRCSLLK